MNEGRLLDKEHQPTEADIAQTIGQALAVWNELRRFIEASYDLVPEVKYGGKNYGWLLHYRQGRRTLCDLYPETDAFTVLIVLGKQESEAALAQLDRLSPEVRRVFENTPPLHDGRWLWLRPASMDDTRSIEMLLAIKRKPKKL